MSGHDVGTVATTTAVGAAIGAAADWGRGAAIGAGAGAAAGIIGVLLTRGHPDRRLSGDGPDLPAGNAGDGRHDARSAGLPVHRAE